MLNAKKAPKTGGNRVPQAVIETGTYPARVVQVIDLGLQPQRVWQGNEKPPAHEIQITYELVDEFLKDADGNDDTEKPRWLSENFPMRSPEADLAKSTKRYKAIDPSGAFDWDFSLIPNSGCNVVVGQYISKKDGQPRNKVLDVTAMRAKEVERLDPLVNEPKVFSLDDPDMEIFLSLPEWLQEKIKSNLEYQGSPLQKLVEGGSPSSQQDSEEEEEDDVPPFTEEEDEDNGEENGAW